MKNQKTNSSVVVGEREPVPGAMPSGSLWALRSSAVWLLPVALPLVMSCGGADAPPPQAATAAPPQRAAPGKLAREKFEKASAEAKTGKADQGALESEYKAVVADDDSVAEAHYNLGLLAQRAGRLDEAEAKYKKALSLDAMMSPAAESLASVMVGRGQIDEAQKVLESFIEKHQAATGPRVALARIYRDKKKYDEGIVQCRAALQREPKNVGAFETLAQLYADAGNLPMAKLVAARGFKVEPNDAVLHHTLGRIFLAENKVPEGVASLKAAIAADPSFRPARIDLAEVALQYRDFGNAKDNFVELLKDTPDDIGLLLGLGIANKGLGQYDEAKSTYQKVLAKQQKHPLALLDLAILHHRHLNDFQGALDYYKAYAEHPVEEGPKPEQLKGYIMEMEATVAALKEAEKLQQMADAQQKEMEAQQQREQPKQAPEEQQAAPNPSGEGAAPTPPATGG